MKREGRTTLLLLIEYSANRFATVFRSMSLTSVRPYRKAVERMSKLEVVRAMTHGTSLSEHDIGILRLIERIRVVRQSVNIGACVLPDRDGLL